MILLLVIGLAGVSIYYWYRLARRAPAANFTVPSIKWSKNFGVDQQFVTSPVLAEDGSLYIASVLGSLYSLDSSGEKQWEYHTNEFIAGGLLRDADKNIYFTTLSKVFSLNSSGRKRWEIDCPQPRMWQDDQGSAVDGNNLYTHCGKNFVALNKNDGTKLWSNPPLDMEAAPAVLKDGTVIGVSASHLIATDRDGNNLWKYPGESGSDAVPLDTPIAVGNDGILYAGSRLSDRFVALDSHGAVQWSFRVHTQPFRSSPVIAADGTIYAITMQQLVYAIGPDGAEKWEFQLPRLIHAENHSAPVLGSDGTIYILAEEKLVALSPEGQQLWELPLPGSCGGSPALTPDGTLYIPTIEGVLYAVQTASHGLMQSPWPRYQHDLSNSGRELGPGGR